MDRRRLYVVHVETPPEDARRRGQDGWGRFMRRVLLVGVVLIGALLWLAGVR